MADWLYEDGIGETRAALVVDGEIVEAMIEPDDDGARPGAIMNARLVDMLGTGEAGRIELESGEPAILAPTPTGRAEGATLLVEITRCAIAEPGRPKLAKARPAPDGIDPRPGPGLAERIGRDAIAVPTHGPDLLEQAGWSQLLDEAATGAVGFGGGALRVSLTPAMTLIDVDGALPRAALACAGAAAAGRAIRRHGIAGSIGIDLPTLDARTERQAAAAALDAALDVSFERTAVNGFGFLQVVRRRERASIPELVQYQPATAAARILLRRAEHAGGRGALTLTANPAVHTALESRADWLATLERRRGAAVRLAADPSLALHAGHIAAEYPG